VDKFNNGMCQVCDICHFGEQTTGGTYPTYKRIETKGPIIENIFTSVMAESKGFLPTNKKMPSHIKRKKMQKNAIHLAAANFQLKKKEKRKKRKKEKEGRKLRPTAVQSRPTAGLDLASHRDPRLGLAGRGFGFFFFFLVFPKRWVWGFFFFFFL
jgi:hypothetical protein